MASRHNLHSRSGYTLLEWLVIAVIVIIFALIMAPVFRKARSSAIRPSCQTNLKELALAFRMYAGDHNGRLPASPSGRSDLAFETEYDKSGESSTTWVGALREYIGRPGVYHCPTDSEASDASAPYYYKHAVNLASRAGIPVKEFAYPAVQIILYERRSFHWRGEPIADGATINVAFLDGHAKSVNMVDVAPDKEPRYFNHLSAASPYAATVKKPYWDPRCCYDKL